MDGIENMEDTHPTMDSEVRSPSRRTSSPFKPACWPTSPVLEPFLDPNAQIFPTPSEFPLLPTPTGPPLHVQAQFPTIHSLDGKNLPTLRFLKPDSEPKQGSPQDQAITTPLLRGFDSARNETQTVEAIKKLEAHIRERRPYVHLASSRLQAATRMRNGLRFQLPQALPNLAPNSIHRTSSGMMAPNTSGKMTFKARGRSGARAAVKSIKIPMKMHTVDQETGWGLREFLLEKGKELGHKKRNCKSVSIHDFTPDMRTLAHQNVLLGHFDAERGARVDAYEVDLPTVTTNPATGEATSCSETWLWILIQRPVVSFHDSNIFARISSLQASLALDAPPLTTLGLGNLPPNFPRPVSSSWVVFAAPLARVTAYPESIEKVADSPTKTKWGGKDKRVHKRVDYDFSHDGVPLFEFSSADMFQGHRTEFLSVEKIAGFRAGDEYRTYSEEYYHDVYQKWLGGGGSEGDGFGKMPCPNQGAWWAEFYRRVAEDCDMWERMRRAMEMGKCRVVLRWHEHEGAQEDEDKCGSGADYDPLERGTASGGKGEKRTVDRVGGVHDKIRRIMGRRSVLYRPAAIFPAPMVPVEKTTSGGKKET